MRNAQIWALGECFLFFFYYLAWKDLQLQAYLALFILVRLSQVSNIPVVLHINY